MQLETRIVSTDTLADIDKLTDAWNLYRRDIEEYLSNHEYDETMVSSEFLEAAGYSTIRKYKLNSCLISDNAPIEWYVFLIKSAMLSIHLNHDSLLPKFIYQQDKQCNREARNIEGSIYDRFDTFLCGIEAKTIIRHFGTAHGQAAYANLPKNRERSSKNSKIRRADFRSTNKEFLRGLMYGFGLENNHRKLICPLDGSTIEGLYTFCENTHVLMSSDCYEIHHAKYDNIGSFYKSISPSSYMNKEDFRDLQQDVIEEFLGCIILSQSSHARIHQTHSVDGINNWINRHKTGRCIFIPYHWRSEDTYNATLSALDTLCVNFTAASATSYADFLIKHDSMRPRS